MKNYTKKEAELLCDLVEIMGENYDDSTLSKEIIFENAWLDLDTKDMYLYPEGLDKKTFYALTGIAVVKDFNMHYEAY